MNDREARIEHNKQAIEAAEKAKQALYPGMINAVEMPKECMNGHGIIAVTDDVFELIAEQHKYHPAFMDRAPNEQPAKKPMEKQASAEAKPATVKEKPVTVRTFERKPLSALL